MTNLVYVWSLLYSFTRNRILLLTQNSSLTQPIKYCTSVGLTFSSSLSITARVELWEVQKFWPKVQFPSPSEK